MLKQQLVESLRLRVLNIPRPPNTETDSKTRVAVLFSGGLDCTVLARLCHEILGPDQGIDLLNVGFENPRVVAQLKKDSNGEVGSFYEACPDRMTGRKSFAELQKVCPGRAFRFVAVSICANPIVAVARAHSVFPAGKRPVFRDAGAPPPGCFSPDSPQH